jgi:hypothetical protein
MQMPFLEKTTPPFCCAKCHHSEGGELRKQRTAPPPTPKYTKFALDRKAENLHNPLVFRQPVST